MKDAFRQCWRAACRQSRRILLFQDEDTNASVDLVLFADLLLLEHLEHEVASFKLCSNGRLDAIAARLHQYRITRRGECLLSVGSIVPCANEDASDLDRINSAPQSEHQAKQHFLLMETVQIKSDLRYRVSRVQCKFRCICSWLVCEAHKLFAPRSMGGRRNCWLPVRLLPP